MSGATASGSGKAAERTAVFVPPSQRDDQVRMRRAHAAAARKFGVEATGPEVWGDHLSVFGKHRRQDRTDLRLGGHVEFPATGTWQVPTWWPGLRP